MILRCVGGGSGLFQRMNLRPPIFAVTIVASVFCLSHFDNSLSFDNFEKRSQRSSLIWEVRRTMVLVATGEGAVVEAI